MAKPEDFMNKAAKAQCILAADMAEELSLVISSYVDKVPLALAVGVLRIVEKELME